MAIPGDFTLGISPAQGHGWLACAGGGHCTPRAGQLFSEHGAAQAPTSAKQHDKISDGSKKKKKIFFFLCSRSSRGHSPPRVALPRQLDTHRQARPGGCCPAVWHMQKAQGAALPRSSLAWQPRGWPERCFIMPLLLTKPPQEVFGFWARPADEEGVHRSRAGQGRAGCMCSLLLTRCRAVCFFHQTFCVTAAADTGPPWQ